MYMKDMLKIMTRNGMTCMSQSIMIQATTWLSFMHNATALCENMKDDYKMSDWLPVKRFVLKINFYCVDFIRVFWDKTCFYSQNVRR